MFNYPCRGLIVWMVNKSVGYVFLNSAQWVFSDQSEDIYLLIDPLKFIWDIRSSDVSNLKIAIPVAEFFAELAIDR